jgi:hypothetical protein
VWTRPVDKKQTQGTPAKRPAKRAKLLGNVYVLPYSVRRQISSRAKDLKKTSQFKKPYTDVIRCAPPPLSQKYRPKQCTGILNTAVNMRARPWQYMRAMHGHSLLVLILRCFSDPDSSSS